MTKRVFIVHGWDYNPEMNWYPWLKKELEKKGFEVIVPEMPSTSEPEISSWTSYLKNEVNDLNDDTYFVGHSIGCQTIMKYLENQNTKAGGALFVAGWFKLDNLEGEKVEKIAEPWLKENINFDKVKENMGELKVFLSDNDHYDQLEYNSKIFREKLNAKVIIEKNKGHFTEEDGVSKMPKVIEAILNMNKQREND